MQSSIISNEFIYFVYTSGLMIVFIVFILILFVIGFRLWSIKKEKEIKKFNRKWKIIFKKINYEIPPFLPKIKKDEEFLFLKIFSDAFESANQTGKQNLLEFASYFNLVEIVSRMLKYDNGNYVMLAIRTAGHLKNKDIQPKIVELINHPNSLISILAAQAMYKISPRPALEIIIPNFVQKQEWIPNKILLILKGVDPKDITQILLDTMKKTPEQLLPRLLKLFVFMEKNKAHEEAKKLLEIYSDPEIISAALHYIDDEKEKQTIFTYLTHKSWTVRMHAIKALIKMITPEDISKVLHLLSDSAWWVRYHTAELIVNQSFVDKEYIKKLDMSLSDKYAKDILYQAWNKREMNEHI